MKLSDAQILFTALVGKLITFAFSTQNLLIIKEAFRPKETAALYAQQGKGIANSLHTKGLAVDFVLLTDHGKLLSRSESYAALGSYWKTLHPLARWGGDFSKPDGGHFSLEWEGVR